MKHPLVVGLQYGDEGKGKITDYLACQADWVIRFNGGNNAGHTLWLNGKKVVTHSVPSGVLSKQAKNFIGAGCVLDAKALEKELVELEEAGAKLDPSRLKIDFRTHLIFPIHIAMDKLKERGTQGIGTTQRGIGPAYASKTTRLGLRVGDLFRDDAEDKLKILCASVKPHFSTADDQGDLETLIHIDSNVKALREAQKLLRPYISWELAPFFDIAQNSKCLLEGAQGILLDMDHGSYPYVTSSNTLPAYAAIGAPFPFTALGTVMGVAKAYVTRVGRGPLPTEILGETGDRIREHGSEYGATTGRPRRIGWLDGDELRDAVRLSDCKAIVLTKSDVLEGEKEVKIRIGGQLQTFVGWKNVLSSSKTLDSHLETFVKALEAHVGAQVVAVGLGPDREELFWRQKLQFWAQ